MSDVVLCTMCQRPEEAHAELRHPFTPEGKNAGTEWLKPKESTPGFVGPSGNTSSPVIQTSSLPFDPVLRTALLKKGLLTMEDLEEADAFIRAVGGALNGNQEPK
jgi:hypothetical protein